MGHQQTLYATLNLAAQVMTLARAAGETALLNTAEFVFRKCSCGVLPTAAECRGVLAAHNALRN